MEHVGSPRPTTSDRLVAPATPLDDVAIALPAASAPPPADPLAAPSGDPAANPTDETPEMRRAMAVVEQEYPCGGYYGARRLLVRAIVSMGEAEVRTDLERRVRAAYAGDVLDVMPPGLINPTPMDWSALWLSQQLPGAQMHVYRALVATMLEHVRTIGAVDLSPEQARLYSVYRKAQSELETEGL
jgi:hypothetical protein